MRHTYTLIMTVLTMSLVGCNGGGDAKGGGGSGSSSVAALSNNVVATYYEFEVSGNGVTFSADLHGYAESNFGGAQTNPTYNSVLLGATTVNYTLTSESFIANITLNTGAGVLTIVTKKNGNILRTDTINTNATGISFNDAN